MYGYVFMYHVRAFMSTRQIRYGCSHQGWFYITIRTMGAGVVSNDGLIFRVYMLEMLVLAAQKAKQ